MAYKQITECPLIIGEKWCDSFLVIFPVSYRYNGGIVIGDEWYDGYEVVKPEVPAGFELVSIGCGLQLNAHPPYATRYLKPLDGKKKSRSEVKAALFV